MSHDPASILPRLGRGEAIEAICRSVGWSRQQFDCWWQAETARRAPRVDGQVKLPVREPVEILRDAWNVPHLVARGDGDLWCAFGYAMAQDRMFQLDYLRRKGHGRLAEVLGESALPLDLTARTVGLPRIALAELAQIPPETLALLEAFSQGVNAWIEASRVVPALEFDLLEYRPEPWSPVDCLAIEGEFRWYLTGRFPVIAVPELARRQLGDGPLYRELLWGEADDEAILPSAAYAGLSPALSAEDRLARLAGLPREAVGQTTGTADAGGSNNWVVAGRHCTSGKPLLASDPHIAIEAVSCWYEAHLHSDNYQVVGMAYVGMPALMFGRNRRVAWGLTNNICSLRDLYQERTDPAHPGCFLYDGKWEPGRQVVEEIAVRGRPTQRLEVRFSRNGPVVDAILPPPADRTGPVSLRWLGAEQGGWLTSLVAMGRSRSVAEFRQTLRPWHVPTFNAVVADVEGNFAVQCTGRIPIRLHPERGYRPGWDPAHQWQGLIPFEAMPHATNDPRGFYVTANNRLAADDYPYPLSGTWISGYRGRRIRQLIEERIGTPSHSSAATQGSAASNGSTQGSLGLDDFRRMQHDTLSLRAVACVPSLVAALESGPAPASLSTAVDGAGNWQESIALLKAWDGRVTPESAPAALFNVFHTLWTRRVMSVYFAGPAVELASKQAEGLASRLLADDPQGWFPAGQRLPAIQQTFAQTLQLLTERLGPKSSDWQWGQLHRLPLVHVLASRGDLGQLLNHGGCPVPGDGTTVCNTGSGPDWLAVTGAGYRLIADLASDALWAVDAGSHSGNPGTPHYADQLEGWLAGKYHLLPLDCGEAAQIAVYKLNVLPQSTEV